VDAAKFVPECSIARGFQMKIQNLLQQCLTMLLMLTILLYLPGMAAADPVDELKEVPASAAEIGFINRAVDQIKASVPPIDGWERTVSVYTSQRSVRDGMQTKIYESARDYPLNVSIRLNFKTITEADRQQAIQDKSNQQLEQEMMAAVQSGDVEKMQQLQARLMVSLQAQMEAGPIGQAAGLSPIKPKEQRTEFYVQIIVNGDGEHIGKQYDVAVPGVTKAFRLDKGNSDHLGYKYYMGAWAVSEFDAKNWRIVFPVADQTPTNHLRALVLFASVAGDRESVESYTANSLNLEGLNDVLN
jgi:hypothetical protein